MVNNTWMQVPVGYVVQNGAFVPGSRPDGDSI
jgi:hypothetical protein